MKTARPNAKQILVGCGEWGFREMPMVRHFEIAHSFGFRFLEFGIGGGKLGRLTEKPGESEIQEFLNLGRRFQIATPFCCIENDFTLPDPAAHRRMVEKVVQQMAAAWKCQAKQVRLFAGFTPLSEMTERLWQQLLDALEECQITADKLGLQVALETHGAIHHGIHGEALHLPTVTTEREALRRLLAEMPAQIGINFDPGNIKAAMGSADDLLLDLLNDRITYCHLKDWKRDGEGWVACGVGDDDLDYGALIPQMRFDGVYLIEYEPLHDTEGGIKRSLESLKASGLFLTI